MSWVLTGFENHHQLSLVSQSYQRFIPQDFFNKLGAGKSALNVEVTDMQMMVLFCFNSNLH